LDGLTAANGVDGKLNVAARRCIDASGPEAESALRQVNRQTDDRCNAFIDARRALCKQSLIEWLGLLYRLGVAQTGIAGNRQTRELRREFGQASGRTAPGE